MITKLMAKKFYGELNEKMGKKNFTLNEASLAMSMSLYNCKVWLQACRHFGMIK